MIRSLFRRKSKDKNPLGKAFDLVKDESAQTPRQPTGASNPLVKSTAPAPTNAPVATQPAAPAADAVTPAAQPVMPTAAQPTTSPIAQPAAQPAAPPPTAQPAVQPTQEQKNPLGKTFDLIQDESAQTPVQPTGAPNPLVKSAKPAPTMPAPQQVAESIPAQPVVTQPVATQPVAPAVAPPIPAAQPVAEPVQTSAQPADAQNSLVKSTTLPPIHVPTITPAQPATPTVDPSAAVAQSAAVSAAQVATPEAATPEVVTPQAAAPQVATPPVAAPQVATPQAVAPQVATPPVADPQALAPQAVAPQVATPQVATPQVATPQVATPEVATPEVATPPVVAPQVATPPAARPQRSRPRTARGGPALISLDNVTKAYETPNGPFLALKKIDLRIGKGEFVAVVGKSGSGKSTLINMITGIDRPTDGEIHIADTAIHNLGEGPMAEWRGRNVGVIFQFFQLLPMLTCVENVMLPMDFCKMYKTGERRKRALHLLDMVEMADQADKLPSEVSGGQQQRVAIARALSNDPPVLVADEPTGNLDSKTADAVFQMFERLIRGGKTILMVTHDDELAMRVTRRITIADGVIVGEEQLR